MQECSSPEMVLEVFDGNLKAAHVMGSTSTPLGSSLRKADAYIEKAALAISAIILLSTLYFVSWLPIYPDEVAFKMLLERYFLNGGFKQSLMPYCGEVFLVPPPYMLRPAAALWSLVTCLGIDWSSYRILSIVLLVSLIVTLMVNSYRSGKRYSWSPVLLVAVGPAMYGLITFRPEIFLVAGAAFSYFIFRNLMSQRKGWKILGFSVLALLIYNVLVYGHPKSLYLTPFYLLGYVFAARTIDERRFKILYLSFCLLLTAAIAFSAVKFYSIQALSCPEYPRMMKALNQQALNPLDLFKNPGQFYAHLKLVTGKELNDHAFNQICFLEKPDIRYLPKVETGEQLIAVANRMNRIVLVVAFASTLIRLISLPFQVGTTHFRERLLVALIWVGLVLPFVLSLRRNWYDESAFVGALAVSMSLFAMIPLRVEGAIGTVEAVFQKLLTVLLITTTILSSWVIFQKYTTAFREGYAGPGIPLQIDRSVVNASVKQLLASRNIPEGTPMIVDDMTYEPLKNRRVIVPITYLLKAMDKPEVIRHTLDRLGIRYGIVRTRVIKRYSRMTGWQPIESKGAGSTEQSVTLFSTDVPASENPK
jgi:hypothetical protein